MKVLNSYKRYWVPSNIFFFVAGGVFLFMLQKSFFNDSQSKRNDSIANDTSQQHSPVSATAASKQLHAVQSEHLSQPELSQRQSEPNAGRLVDYGKFAKLLEDPDFVAAFMDRDQDSYRKKHAKVFKRLKLTEDQVDKVCATLSEQHMAMLDAAAAAGSPSDPVARRVTAANQAEFDKKLVALIGKEAVEQLRGTDERRWIDEKMGSLERRLAFGSEPLTSEQAVLLQPVFSTLGLSLGSTPLPPDRIEELQRILSPHQYARFATWYTGQGIQYKVQNRYDK